MNCTLITHTNKDDKRFGSKNIPNSKWVYVEKPKLTPSVVIIWYYKNILKKYIIYAMGQNETGLFCANLNQIRLGTAFTLKTPN